jgi:two-component system phosphate regulon sensor histidine kinase PhoR
MFRRRLTKTALRALLGGVFVAVAVPTVLLIRQAFGQLETDALRRHELAGRALAESIDARLRAAVAVEDARAAADYDFLIVPARGAAPRRTELSAFPVTSLLPGVIGYFQVDPDGMLTTPLLPTDADRAREFGVSADEVTLRSELERRIGAILGGNSIEAPASGSTESAPAIAAPESVPLGEASRSEEAEMPAARPARSSEKSAAGDEASIAAARANQLRGGQAVRQAVFDDLAEKAESRSQASSVPSSDSQPPLARADAEADALGAAAGAGPINTFDREVEPMRFMRLGTGEFVLFRNAWLVGRRLVQGALVEPRAFIASAIAEPFVRSDLADAAEIVVAFLGEDLFAVGRRGVSELPRAGAPAARSGETLRMSPPFAGLELKLEATQAPSSPASVVLSWLSVVLAGVLVGGFALIYRMGLRQIELGQLQRDFVAAVSHELKTPLTSIRMYGEMLRAGWADEGRKRRYYDFIYAESERLSRLIDNVLTLAKIERQDRQAELEDITAGALLELCRTRVAVQARAAGIDLIVEASPDASSCVVRVDRDAFTQIMINLVDNAIKYSAGAAERRVVMAVSRRPDRRVAFSVRDFGAGVPRAKAKRLFEPFYRSNDAATRSVPGTGIGLALVNELARSMDGEVDVRNRQPGAEFEVVLPVIVDAGST